MLFGLRLGLQCPAAVRCGDPALPVNSKRPQEGGAVRGWLLGTREEDPGNCSREFWGLSQVGAFLEVR